MTKKLFFDASNNDLPPLEKNTLRIVPLGGLGAIGRNMMTVEYEGKILILDCGVLFPDEQQPGVDLILPDFSYIQDRMDDVEAVILTHGHEDHIGAVPYLLKMKEDLPIIGSRLTLALVESKLHRARIKNPNLIQVKDGQTVKNGKMELTFVAVNHSIPDAMAVHIKTPAGTILDTGDIKLDQTPIDGRITDLVEMGRLGKLGVDLFMVDSTNAEQKGFLPSEKTIGPILEQLFRDEKNRIVVAAFSSHVHRVQQVIDAAKKSRRKVALVGNSMIKNMNKALELGYLTAPADIFINSKKLDEIHPSKVVIMCTGTQGEPMAALSRMARGDHDTITLQEDDLVVLASSIIPGNETGAFKVINELSEIGVNVVYNHLLPVHVSGHARQGELLYLYNTVKPINVMPVHGEYKHLRANAKIAAQTGVPEENIFIGKNGTVIDLHNHKAKIVGNVPVGLLFVEGNTVGEINEDDLTTRKTLSNEGIVSLYCTVDTVKRKVISSPVIRLRGVAQNVAAFDDVLPDITARLEEKMRENDMTEDELSKVAHKVLGQFVGRKLRISPLLLSVIKDTDY